MQHGDSAFAPTAGCAIGHHHDVAYALWDLLFILQIFSLYVTGSINTIISLEHRREMLRYIYNHQIIGAYDWLGNNPIIPELWMVPYALPTHPGN
nr:unnamed protein product [Digitaria exilis]